jgi:predicted small metal-binding protein
LPETARRPTFPGLYDPNLEEASEMAKELRCGDIMPGCDFVAQGEDEAEVMSKAAEHAREKHGLDEIDEETAEKVRSQIRSV